MAMAINNLLRHHCCCPHHAGLDIIGKVRYMIILISWTVLRLLQSS